MEIGNFIYRWIDVLWVPVGLFVVHKEQRVGTFFFIITCIFTLRTQIELMEWTGTRTGFLNILKTDVYHRGLIVYSAIIALFLAMANYSAATKGVIFFAASISIYIFAFCASMLIMVL